MCIRDSNCCIFAGSYFFKMIGLNIGLTDWQNFLFAFGIITLVVIMNYLSPIIASRFQISATVVKLIPILLIAIGGLFASLIVGNDYGIILALIHIYLDVVSSHPGA